MVKEKCCCLIRHSSVAIANKGSLERHFLSLHSKYQLDYPVNSNLRIKKIADFKTQLSAQQSLLKKSISKSICVTTASL